MKAHTSQFKENISNIGRELDSKITYTINGTTIELGTEELNSITPHYKGDILKSVMKQLDIDSNVDIPVGTTINYQFGVKVNGQYEYLDFGNYIVNSSEKQEDVNSYKIVAYDKMLYSMVDYEDIGITYPISIRNYINAICTHLGITFANANDPFTNYDKEIPSELYLSNGSSMGYKFRDVLDELAQATASTICINDDDELEIRYVQDIEHAIETKTGTNINITNALEKPIQETKLSKLSTQDGTPTPSNPVEVDTVKGYRNLLNVLDLNQTYANVECVKNSDNSYTLDGTANSNYAINIIDNWSLTLPAGTYTLYGCADMGGKDTLSIELYSNSPNNKYFTDIGNGITFTTTEERTFRCYIAIKNTKQYDNVKVYPMLVAGSEKLPYVPYGNNYIYETISDGTNSNTILIPLNNNEICGIGDYKDELVIDKNGHATLTKKIGKVVLDENTVFSNSTTNVNYSSFFIEKNDMMINKTLKANYFTQMPIGDATSASKVGIASHSTLARIYVTIPTSDTPISTFMSTHNTEVYYVLAEPTTIDLGTITPPTLFSGTNYISNSDTMDMSIKYLTTQITNDVIDEEFFKDVNVDFGEKYGPINSIVLSRSAGSDNIYEQDNASILANGLCELKISDNQIMNGNDRDEYLQGIFSRLNGLEYYINDYSSTGITYYDICDRYIARIGNNDYSCVMFNDEILVTQGLEENIYTEMPIPSETDYSKADKTDRRINQTYLIVDKQNGVISSVVSETVDTTNPNSIASKQSVLTQRVDNLESAISDIADITTSGESSYATIDLDSINESEPVSINIKPIGTNISYLYPSTSLYPSQDLYMSDRRIRFHNRTTNEDIDYILPDDLLYYDSDNYDEFVLDYNSQTCKVNKKCKYNADGTVGLLSSPQIDNYTYPTINLSEGNYTISIYGYSTGYIMTRLMTSNIYTEQFYTKVETNSLINQTASSIDLSVNQKLSNYSTTTEMNSAINVKANEINSMVATKVGNDEVISKINQTPEQITINANKLNLTGYVTATNLATSGQTIINGDNIKTGAIESQNYVPNVSGTKIDMSNGVIDSKNFKVASNGDTTFKGLINGGSISVIGEYDYIDAYVEVKSPNSTDNTPILTKMWNNGISVMDYSNDPDARIRTEVDGEYAELHNGEVNAFAFNDISLAEKKENFEKLKSGLDIIKSTDIYKYNYKDEKRKKKHIGLVIGKDYNYSKELTNEKNDSVDLYSMIGVCFKAIQEQQEEIEILKQEINKLKESDK